MKHIINITYICIVILMCSCYDIAGGTEIEFTNDSSHHIKMIDFAPPYDDNFAAGIELLPGETVFFNDSDFYLEQKRLDFDRATFQTQVLLPNRVTVVFDNQYAISYSQEGEHKALCSIEYYIPSSNSPTSWCYTYHFTDEDYEHARKHGEEIE